MWLGFQAFGASFLGRNSYISELLDKEDITLEELLEKDDTILEARSLNPKLLRFITSERQAQLIQYITTEPSVSDSPKRIYSYPFAASEFFGPDCHDILVRFFEEEQLLDTLFQFLNTEEALNLTLAGYFNKAVSSLIRKNPSEMLAYMCQKHNYAINLTKHMYSSSIAELIDKILSAPITAYTTYKLEILQAVLKKIELSASLEEIVNSANVLQSFILKHPNITDGDSLMRSLWTEDNLHYLIQKLLCRIPYTVRAAASVVKSLLYSTVPDLSSDEESTEKEEEKAVCIIDVYLSFMPDIIVYLISDSSQSLATSYGEKISPFGEDKILLIEILYVALRKGYTHFIHYILQFKVLNIVTELFVRHPWNTVLHNLYVNIVTFIVASDDSQLIRSVFEDAKLAELLVKIGTNSSIQLESGKEIRLGYAAHITRLSNLLLEKAVNNSYISEVLSSTEGWESYKNSILSQINQLENKLLGGKALNQMSSSQSEEDFFEQRDSIGSDFITFNRDAQNEEKEDKAEREERSYSFEDLVNRAQDEELLQYNSNVFWKVEDESELEELE